MKNEEVKVFIQGLENFFSKNFDDAGDVAIGEISECDPSESPAHDLTGIIGISGDRKGCIYFTAEESLITQVLTDMGEEDVDTELLNDMTGEIANTIAGYAMSISDSAFELSVPVVVTGKPNSIYLPKKIRACVISVQWKDASANLVVCIE